MLIYPIIVLIICPDTSHIAHIACFGATLGCFPKQCLHLGVPTFFVRNSIWQPGFPVVAP